MTVPLQPFAVLQSATLKPSEVARRLGVERTTVYRWIKSGKLPSFELGGSTYILVVAYEHFAERHKKRTTLEQQAARYIGAGVEVEGDVDMYAGLPFPGSALHAVSETAAPTRSFGDVRQAIREQLDAYEARFGIPSERIHREVIVEHQSHVPGVPDDVAAAWASCYATYASLSLMHAL